MLVDDLLKLVAACCVLHNVCEIRDKSFDEEWMQGVGDDHSSSTPCTNSVVESGKNTGEALMTYFCE